MSSHVLVMPLIRGWMFPGVGLGDMENCKFLTLTGLELRYLDPEPVAILYSDFYAATHYHYIKRMTVICRQ